MKTNTAFSLTLNNIGDKLEISVNKNGASPCQIFFMKKVKNDNGKESVLLKYSKKKRYLILCKEFSDHFLMELRTAIYRHLMEILRHNGHVKTNLSFPFSFTYIPLEERVKTVSESQGK